MLNSFFSRTVDYIFGIINKLSFVLLFQDFLEIVFAQNFKYLNCALLFRTQSVPDCIIKVLSPVVITKT